ncbi:hypothetical protein FNF31_00016 [Cafeteria roenbergensis]|uniref:GST N-terminal domain-containing protein n=1 Tax=Cafeteria roenbergensis TaxID=33653 RepID=A0A5A8DTS0_CAFRO|nr:hypothetical protein FNF31_00016 [Cafeteria roenbergensis]
MAASSVRIYADFVSQPSRAVILFCRAARIPHEVKLTRLAKGANRTAEFLKLNPLGQVPVAEFEDGWALAESHAIMKYLCATHPEVEDSWYPSDARVRARLDAAMDMQHSQIRRCSTWTFARVMGPLGDLPAASPEVAEWHGKMARRSIKQFDSVLAQSAAEGPGSFLGGTERASIADLSIACELQQLEGVPGGVEFMQPSARVLDWQAAVKEQLQPHWDEVGSVLARVRAAAEAKGLRA